MSIHKYEKPSVAVDIVMLRVVEEGKKDKTRVSKPRIEVLMEQRDKAPEEGKYALPGGFVNIEEELEEKVEKVLKEKVGVEGGYYLEQLRTRGKINRDSRGRVISVSYLALSHESRLEIEKKGRVSWVSLEEVERLSEQGKIAFDHKEIIEDGFERIKGKINYTEIALELLAEEFTIKELQNILELVTGKKVQNIRRNLHIDIESTGRTTEGTHYRPAELYRRRERKERGGE